MMSLGGSDSLPLGRRALWILSISILVWCGLLSRLLNRSVTVGVKCSESIDSGMPLILRLWRRPRLSRSSTWRCISRICRVCVSIFLVALRSTVSCCAVVFSTSWTLSVSAWMSSLNSAIAADRVSLMSAAMVLKSCILRYGWWWLACVSAFGGGEFCGAGIGSVSGGAEVCEDLRQDGAMLLRCVLNSSGIVWLTPLFSSRGERDLEAEDCQEAVPISAGKIRVYEPPVKGSIEW